MRKKEKKLFSTKAEICINEKIVNLRVSNLKRPNPTRHQRHTLSMLIIKQRQYLTFFIYFIVSICYKNKNIKLNSSLGFSKVPEGFIYGFLNVSDDFLWFTFFSHGSNLFSKFFNKKKRYFNLNYYAINSKMSIEIVTGRLQIFKKEKKTKFN